MTEITIAAGGFPHAHNLEEGEIWVIANKSYTTPDGKMLTASAPAEGIFVARVPFTIDGSNVMQVPEIVIDATEDSIDHPDATLGAYIMTTQGRPVSVLSVFRAFGAPASPASTSWPELAAHNVGTLPADVGHDVTITGDLDVSGHTTFNGLTLALGSDADGDMYMRSGDEIVRIPVGGEDATLTVVGGVPAWSGGGGGGSSTLNDGLAAFWKLDGATGAIRADSVGSTDLTDVNSVTQATGKLGNAAQFSSATGNYLWAASNAAVASGDVDFTVCGWVNMANKSGLRYFVTKSGFASSNQDEYGLYYDNAVDRFAIFICDGTFSYNLLKANSFGSPALNTWYFVVAWYDAPANTLNIQVNGGAVDSMAATVVPTNNGGPFGIGVYRLNNGATRSIPDAKIDAVGLWKRLLTSDERVELYNSGTGKEAPFVGAGGGGSETATYTLTVADLWENIDNVARTGYTELTARARLVFDTDATSLSVDIYSNMYSTAAVSATIGIRVNGKDYTTLSATADGTQTKTTSLPSGFKRVEIVSGEVAQASPPKGTWPLSFTVNAAFTIVPPDATGGLLVYGDSITMFPWPQSLRTFRPRQIVIIEGRDARTLHDDAVDGAARTTFANFIASGKPAIIWIEIGTNDYGLGAWSAASFGTAYADLLDKIHAALPMAKIYAQTPTTRSGEGANSFGNTLGDYRAQIATAQATRSSYVTLVDGTLILTVGDLSDGLHPTIPAGDNKYAFSVRGTLGW